MFEKYEKSLQEWYDKSRVAGLEYLDLELPKFNQKIVTKENISFYCFHSSKVQHIASSENPHLNFISDTLLSLENNVSRVFDQVNLGNKAILKHLHQIHKTFENHEAHIEILKRNQDQILKRITQFTTEIENQKPLTVRQVTELVEQIAQQPKIAKAEALRLTENLEVQVKEIKELTNEIKYFLTT